MAEAREQLNDAKKMVAAGKLPAKEKARDKARVKDAETFGAWAEKWLHGYQMADSTRDMRRSVYERELKPKFSNQKLVEITHEDLRALTDVIVERGARATAVHVREIVMQVFRWAIERGQKVENPAELARPTSIARFEPRDRALTPEEIGLMYQYMERVGTQGNSEALTALRARDVAQDLKGNALAAQGKAKPGHLPVIDNITKKGTIIYRAGQSAVRDDGHRLQVSTGVDRAGVLEALRLAAKRYGDRIAVNGTVEFKAQAIRAAVDGKLAITFADPALEKRRQALLQDNFSVSRKTGVPGVGKAPPPAARAGCLRALVQAEALQIEGVVAAVTPQGPAPVPKPALSELARRKAKLQAELSVKKERTSQRKGRGR